MGESITTSSDNRTQKDLADIISDSFGSGKWTSANLSALSLAYIGDCIYDLIIRSIVTTHDGGTNKNLHGICVKLVNAVSQARLIESIEADLSDEENAVFHRGRNAKSSSSAKNASIGDYRKATGLEALVGYLYLNKEYERLVELVKLGLERTGQLQQ